MNKEIIGISIALLFIAVVIMSGCTSNSTKDNEVIDTPSVEDINSTYPDDINTASPDLKPSKGDCITCSNLFAFEMYRELVNSSGDDNVFFSPYSISTAIGMAFEGANGKTATEISAVLGLPTDRQTRLNQTKDLQSSLNNANGSYELNTVNAYWLAQGGTLKPDYKTAIEDYYLAHGEELNFAGDPEGSADTINEWVENKTNDRIKDLLSPKDLDLLTYLVLTNAIYFKSDWKYQFNVNDTEDRDFTPTDGETFKTPTMHMCNKSIWINYTENDDVQMLSLPYKDDELSMRILLPKNGDINTLEQNLDLEYINGLKNDSTPEYMDVYLPKFKFEQKYKLNDPLCALGMPTAFSFGADFSGISDEPLYIDSVIHQSYVALDEKGTEAAAATAVIIKRFCISPEPEPIVFKADHPFLFLIEHKETGQILFMGKVENPGGL